MARNGDIHHRPANATLADKTIVEPLNGKIDRVVADGGKSTTSPTTLNLLVCVGGIYASL